jgi:hypothetical protein
LGLAPVFATFCTAHCLPSLHSEQLEKNLFWQPQAKSSCTEWACHRNAGVRLAEIFYWTEIVWCDLSVIIHCGVVTFVNREIEAMVLLRVVYT